MYLRTCVNRLLCIYEWLSALERDTCTLIQLQCNSSLAPLMPPQFQHNSTHNLHKHQPIKKSRCVFSTLINLNLSQLFYIYTKAISVPVRLNSHLHIYIARSLTYHRRLIKIMIRFYMRNNGSIIAMQYACQAIYRVSQVN